MAKKNKHVDQQVEVETAVIEAENPVDEPVEESVKKKVVTGVVHNCSALNVRKTPVVGNNIVGTITSGRTVEINETKSSDEFYRIKSQDGVLGYCMKKYIKIQ